MICEFTDRAGVEGRGFAVVAEEVRKLAGRANEAAAAGDVQLNATEQVADQTKRLREISDKILHISERFEL